MALILGIKVRRDRPKHALYLDQSDYIQGIIKRFRLGDSKPVNLPVSNRNTLVQGLPEELQAN
jgi:hypothetical protein